MSKFEIGLEREYSVYNNGNYSNTLTIQDIDNSNIVLCGESKECEGVPEGILDFIGRSDRLQDTKKVLAIRNREGAPDDFLDIIYETILKKKPHTILLPEATMKDIKFINDILSQNIQLIMSTSRSNLSDNMITTKPIEVFTIVKNK